jgi:hypothetical protein
MADFVVSTDIDNFLKTPNLALSREALGITFDFDKVTNVLMTAAFQSIGLIVTPVRPAGLYRVSFALVYAFDQINKSAIFRYQIDGGGWVELMRENSDITDVQVVTYAFPEDYPLSMVHTIELEGRKEDIAGIMTVNRSDVSFERV